MMERVDKGVNVLTTIAVKPYICLAPVGSLFPICSNVSEHANDMLIGRHSDSGALGVHNAKILAPVEFLRVRLGQHEKSFVDSSEVIVGI